jgi:AraC-like DNA-binding protein
MTVSPALARLIGCRWHIVRHFILSKGMRKTIMTAPLRHPPELRGKISKTIGAIRAAVQARETTARYSRRARVAECIRQLELRLREQPSLPMSSADLTSLFSMERTYCSRVFRLVCGRSFTTWFRSIRIQQAKHLLCFTNMPIGEISRSVGYSDLTTFERNFRKEVGVCPEGYRRASGKRSAVEKVLTLERRPR